MNGIEQELSIVPGVLDSCYQCGMLTDKKRQILSWINAKWKLLNSDSQNKEEEARDGKESVRGYIQQG